MRVAVVGCGVIGLSAAIRLLEVGHYVRIVARDLPPNTTSDIAAAIWFPYLAAPRERVLGWAADSYAEFARLATTTPSSGVRMARLIELVHAGTELPWWRDAVPDCRWAAPAELPSHERHGVVATIPVVQSPIYLPFLVERVRALGGRIEQRHLESLTGIDADIAVNCSGLGAHQLAVDATAYPIAGQVVSVARGSIDTVWMDERDPARPMYVIPRADDCILGGTSRDHDWSIMPDADVARDIQARCAHVEPALRTARVLSTRVGLRPGRPAVRLELSHEHALPVIHNYGHGGAGVTLSWGCAREVAELVDAYSKIQRSVSRA
jgi:D-amino-acid oxidase